MRLRYSLISIFLILLIIGFAYWNEQLPYYDNNSDSTYYNLDLSHYVEKEKICKPISTPQTVIKSIDLVMDFGETSANRVVYNYLKKHYKEDIDTSALTTLTGKDFNENSIHAFWYDLNDDGINEVIGIPYQTPVFCGLHTSSLFILQKSGNEYEKIGEISYYYFEGVVTILKEKTNNYHNIQFRKEADEPSITHNIYFHKDENRYFYENLCE